MLKIRYLWIVVQAYKLSDRSTMVEQYLECHDVEVIMAVLSLFQHLLLHKKQCRTLLTAVH